MVLLAIGPLTAAQIMLHTLKPVSRNIFDTGGGSATLWMHFFWIFGHPEVCILVLPGSRSRRKSFGVFTVKRFLATGYGRGHGRHRVRLLQRVGTSSVYHRDDVDEQRTSFAISPRFLVSVPTGIKIFNWIGTMWGGKIRFRHSDALLHLPSFANSSSPV